MSGLCGTEMRDVGYGTEKIEDEAAKAFPDARMERMDLDTTRSRTAYERNYTPFCLGRHQSAHWHTDGDQGP